MFKVNFAHFFCLFHDFIPCNNTPPREYANRLVTSFSDFWRLSGQPIATLLIEASPTLPSARAGGGVLASRQWDSR